MPKKKQKTKEKRRKKLATIWEPQNLQVESILRKAHELSGMKAKGTGFGAFILMSALRDATNMIQLAQNLMDREEEEANEGTETNEDNDSTVDDNDASVGDSSDT